MYLISNEEHYKLSNKTDSSNKILILTVKDVNNQEITIEFNKRSADMLKEFADLLVERG